MKKKTIFCLLFASLVGIPSAAAPDAPEVRTAVAQAQPDDTQISGTVEDKDGPMIGATVKVAGSSAGTVTDLNGKFTLRCKPGAMLEVSYVGYTTVKLQAKNGMKIVLEEDKTTLSEVVVTALGVKRERKALGYGLAEVKGPGLRLGRGESYYVCNVKSYH